MKEIPLTQGKVALIDDEDYERVMQYNWTVYQSHKRWTFYAHCHPTTGTTELHRFILGLKRGDRVMVDHRNGNGLDNQKSNLRICSYSENQWNHVIPINNTSGYIGIGYHKKSKKWYARSCVQRKHFYLGSFDNKNKAAIAHDKAVLHLHGDFATLNYPELFFNGAL